MSGEPPVRCLRENNLLHDSFIKENLPHGKIITPCT